MINPRIVKVTASRITDDPEINALVRGTRDQADAFIFLSDIITPIPPADHAEVAPPAAPAPMSWARLLKRVFEMDIEQCPQCGGTLKIIAAIEHPPVITKTLTHLGLPARAPPRAAAKAFDRFPLA